MKDKVAKKANINDILEEYRNIDDPVKNQEQTGIDSITVDDDGGEAYYKKLREYNTSLREDALDVDYCKIKPLHNILVRVFLREPEVTKDGLVKPYKQIVAVPTKNGVADWAEIESPYPYNTTAIVVALPESLSTSGVLRVGKTVQLSKNPVEAKVVGGGNDAYLSIPSAYWSPEYKGETPPKDPTNKHFGYLLIPYFEIKAVIE